MKNLFIPFALLSLLLSSLAMAGPSQEFYELRTYRFKTLEQQERTENYLQKALLPALHRATIKKVGVFKPVETDTTFGKKTNRAYPLPFP